MIVLKDFEKYTPENVEPELLKLRVSFIKNELGDWYDLRNTLSEHKTKVLLDVETKRVVAQTNSNEGIWPLGFILVELDEVVETDLMGLTFDEKTKKFSEYVPSDEESKELAERKLAGLRKIAQSELESLKLAEEIDKLSSSEKSRMKELKTYLVELMRVPKQTGYPQNAIWPELKK